MCESETRSIVTKLKRKLGLVDDGVVGTKTVGKFDQKFADVSSGFSPPPALPVAASGPQVDPASKFLELALLTIGPGSAIFKMDSMDIEWRPRPHACALRFRVGAFIDFGFSLNACISDGRLTFRHLKRDKAHAAAEYISHK